MNRLEYSRWNYNLNCIAFVFWQSAVPTVTQCSILVVSISRWSMISTEKIDVATVLNTVTHCNNLEILIWTHLFTNLYYIYFYVNYLIFLFIKTPYLILFFPPYIYTNFFLQIHCVVGIPFTFFTYAYLFNEYLADNSMKLLIFTTGKKFLIKWCNKVEKMMLQAA